MDAFNMKALKGEDLQLSLNILSFLEYGLGQGQAKGEAKRNCGYTFNEAVILRLMQKQHWHQYQTESACLLINPGCLICLILALTLDGGVRLFYCLLISFLTLEKLCKHCLGPEG